MEVLQWGGSQGGEEQGNESFQWFTPRWTVDSTTVEHQEGSRGLQQAVVGGGRAEELVKPFAISSHYSGCHGRLPLPHSRAQILILHFLTGMKEVHFSEGVRKVEAAIGMEMPM